MKYTMLIVCNNDKLNTLLTSLFSEDYEILISTSENFAKRILVERTIDFIIVSSPLPDSNGYGIVMDYATKIPTIIFVSHLHYDNVYYKLSEYGAITISKPTRSDVVVQAVRMLETAKGSMHEKKKDKPLKEKLEESRKINIAKMLLITNERMSEDDAHKYIVRKAMDLRASKVDIAIDIINKYHKEV